MMSDSCFSTGMDNSGNVVAYLKNVRFNDVQIKLEQLCSADNDIRNIKIIPHWDDRYSSLHQLSILFALRPSVVKQNSIVMDNIISRIGDGLKAFYDERATA